MAEKGACSIPIVDCQHIGFKTRFFSRWEVSVTKESQDSRVTQTYWN